MARFVCDATLLAYPFLPLRMIQWLMKIHINEISYLLPRLSYPSAQNDLMAEGNSGLIRQLTDIQIIKFSTLSAYPVLPLKCDPTVMKTLKEDQRSRMVAEPQLASDLTCHQNSTI
jgi:hypothetical protein